MEHDTSQLLRRAVERVGSQKRLACFLNVSQAAVSKAVAENRCPAEWAVTIEAVTNGDISRSELRPDLWPPSEPSEAA